MYFYTTLLSTACLSRDISQSGRSMTPFLPLCVQIGSGAHPASYPMDTRASIPGGKAAGA
jgi:hypothetical protein